MAEDREILREVWDGRLPVCFRLAVDEVHTVEQPDPCYLMIPRLSYFPLVTDKVQIHFARHVHEQYQNADMWFEYNGQPLKWHYPIGLLYDLYAAEDTLPWNVTVHFQNFPDKIIIPGPCRAAVESVFMSAVKEADSLKHRGQVVNAMQKKDHSQLWSGLQHDKFDQFWAINRKLMEHTNDECFKHIPFRIYQPDKQYIQKIMKPVTERGDRMVLKDLVHLVLPEASRNKVRVVLHGVEPPADTPLQWMSEHLSYPDNFLHICIFIT